MRKVLGADGWRLPALHGCHIHAVVIHQRQSAVGAHHDVVGLDVAVGE